MTGISKGMVAEMIGNGTGLIEGQLQVHAPDYLPDRSVHATIGGRAGTDVETLIRQIEADPAVAAAAPRVFGGGLVSGGRHTVASVLVGIDPRREPLVARLATSLEQGRLPAVGAREVLIGAEMARRIDVTVGDEVVLVAPAADGSLGNDLFEVVGLFRTGLAELDAGYTMLPLDVMQELIVLGPTRVHQIAAQVDDPWAAPGAVARLTNPLNAGRPVHVESWTTFRPEMVDYARLMAGGEWILLAVVFGMAVFGVANTMVMATFERRREFAVLLALGAVPTGIVRAVLSEAVALGVMSLAAGAVIVAPILVWWHHAPVDLSAVVGAFTMSGALMRPVLRVEYPVAMLGGAALALFVTALGAVLYPAWRAARIPPADTLTGR